MKALNISPFARGIAVVLVLCGASAQGQKAVAARAPYAAASSVAVDTPSAGSARASMDLQDIGPGEKLHIVVGHSMVLRGISPMRRIYIGNPAVLQSYTAGPSEVVLTAKIPGLSSLVIWSTTGQSCLYTVSSDVDPDALRQSLAEVYPTSRIQVEGHEGRVYLTGTVPTQEIADGAAKMAAPYAKDVVNSLRVVAVRGKQVQLKLRIVEVDRTRMEQYGINFFSGGSRYPGSLTTGQFASSITPPTGPGVPVMATNPLNLFLYSTGLNLGVTIADLEQKQILQVLAEPTLTAMSGESAKFLSGGQFPFPVVQGGGVAGMAPAITIMFQPYGIKMDFTPTVNADGSIRLKVAPEVSALDYTNAVTISGFTIPALSTRRAETEVEIKSGQTFALSGLLDHRTTENLSQLPGLSRLPVLGKLFISKTYNHSIVELVVLVTATVVDPLTDTTVPPEPKPAVPNMQQNTFDHQLSKEQKIEPIKP
ncbi:MAG: type II and III secretion system protein family protein [Acidobacteriaceae bacterium]